MRAAAAVVGTARERPFGAMHCPIRSTLRSNPSLSRPISVYNRAAAMAVAAVLVAMASALGTRPAASWLAAQAVRWCSRCVVAKRFESFINSITEGEHDNIHCTELPVMCVR